MEIQNSATLLDDSATIKLSRRELEIIKKISEGHRTRDIADLLCISPETVKTHRRNAVRKMNAINCVGLVNICLQNGWM